VVFLPQAGQGRAARPGAAGSGDAGIQQTQDAARVRDAYREATRAVTVLVDRYGEHTVWSWFRLGLPPEVRKTDGRRLPRGPS